MFSEMIIRNYMLDFLESNSDEITDSCVEYVKNIPIEISKRMKKSLGKYVFNPKTNEPVGFKFSYNLVNNHSDKEVEGIIKHELMHLLCNITYGYNCGHNRLWKDMCRRYGVNDSRTSRILTRDDYKYEICCRECGTKFYKHKVSQYMKDHVKEYRHGDCHINRIEIIDTTTGECWR